MKAILVRPEFDEATQYTFGFASDILQACRDAGMEVVELARGEAIRERVEEELAGGFDIYIHYDHGNEGALIGQDEKPVIDSGNCALLVGKETYTLACLSAKRLGVDVWRMGGRYWGYVEVVSFTTDALREFQEAFNCGLKHRFIEGADAHDALAQAKETFSRLSLDLVEVGKTMAGVLMRMNGDNLVYYNGQEPEEREGCLLSLLKLPIELFRRSCNA